MTDNAIDILTGAERIAGFLFGDVAERRRVYELVRLGKLPVFRLGSTICARKSTLRTMIEEQERTAMKSEAVA